MAIECHRVTKAFADRVILQELSVRFNEQRTRICGANGTGKTLLLKLIAGAMTPDSGSITVSTPRGRGISFASDGLKPPPLLNLNEVLQFEAMHNSVDVRRQQQLIDRFGLGPHLHSRYGELSTGSEKKASLLRALSMKSHWLLVDEPFNGLDSEAISAVKDALSEDCRPMLIVDHLAYYPVECEWSLT